jgi:uncharacterized membrane protein
MTHLPTATSRIFSRLLVTFLAIAASLVMGFTIAGNTSHSVAAHSHQTVADICGGATGILC